MWVGVDGAGGILCIYICVEVCGGPCTNAYMATNGIHGIATKCGRRWWCVLARMCAYCVCACANQEKGKMKTSQQKKMIDDDFPVLKVPALSLSLRIARVLKHIIHITLDYHSNLHCIIWCKM